MAELEKLAERFRNLAGRTVPTMEWRGSFHFPREVIAAEARAADLVIISSHTVAEDIYHAFDPGTVLLNAGRPVFVVPDGIASNTGQRVLVAWKDTREARHAVQSALPYLAAAKHITLVEVAENVLERVARERLDDVEKYLDRHGIKVTGKSVLTPKGSISDQLTSVAKSEGADLIVAGAYGHSRLGEWVFGGVTRGLLQNSEVCCLLSELTDFATSSLFRPQATRGLLRQLVTTEFFNCLPVNEPAPGEVFLNLDNGKYEGREDQTCRQFQEG